MNTNLKSALFIAIGAASYGILATIVKYANNQGYGPAGLTFSQYLFGASLLTLLSLLYAKKSKNPQPSTGNTRHAKMKLMLFGTTLGLTSSFYYLSLQYIPVSVAIILLMQTIWMGIVLEFFIARQLITRAKIIGGITAVAGTLLAAKIFESDISLNLPGLGFGLLAALSFTASMYASNKISLQLPTITRSKYLVFGGFLVVLLFWNVQIMEEFTWSVLFKWGIYLGLFGTVLPPLLFSKGFPVIGTGLGSILAAIEIPVSVFSAYLVLNENISTLQWVGIVIILASVVLINLKRKISTPTVTS